MKKFIYVSCTILAILSAGSSYAAQKKYATTSYQRPLEAPRISEEKCIAAVNRVRQEYGLKPLKEWKELSDCARGHSANMANEKCPFGHDGFEKRADHMWSKAYLSAFAENVAYSFNYDDPVALAVDGWMKSPGHKKNILGDFEETGMGVSISKEGKFYVTQLFAKRSKTPTSRR